MQVKNCAGAEFIPFPGACRGGWIGGGGGGGGGSSSFVRNDQDCYNLDNGDRVEYSPMTGNYISTNPLFPTEYAKDGDEFSQL